MRYAVLMVGGLVITAAPSLSRAQGALFSADQEACFGRIYDRAHLAAHPQQKTTSIHAMRVLERRKEAENWQPDERNDEIMRFKEDDESAMSVFVNFRDRPRTRFATVSCGKETKDGIACNVECDGGGFSLKRTSASAALLTNNRFRLTDSCGEDVEEGQETYFEPGKDDKTFLLERKPIAACRIEEQKAEPIPAGKPLRERFKEDEAFCFGSDYDATHLASHPQQMVSSLRVGRLDPAAEKTTDPLYKAWWFNVQIDVALALRSGSARETAHYACLPQTASWECRRESQGEQHTACNDRAIQLVRGPGDELLIQNRRSGLPIDKECETAADTGQFPTLPLTRTDDKIFRLARMPIDACR